MKIILIIGISWHLGIATLICILENRRNGTPLKRLLEMTEIELCKSLEKKIELLPEEKRKDLPLKKWRKEAKSRIERSKSD